MAYFDDCTIIALVGVTGFYKASVISGAVPPTDPTACTVVLFGAAHVLCGPLTSTWVALS